MTFRTNQTQSLQEGGLRSKVVGQSLARDTAVRGSNKFQGEPEGAKFNVR
jgi:hypothetical protein